MSEEWARMEAGSFGGTAVLARSGEDKGSLGYVIHDGGSKKWSDMRYILKVELIALADGYFSVEVWGKMVIQG